MALFKKMSNKLEMDRLKTQSLIEEDMSEVENDLIFGTLREDINDIFSVECETDDLKSLRTEGKHNYDLKDTNDDEHHDGSKNSGEVELPFRPVDSENDLAISVLNGGK